MRIKSLFFLCLAFAGACGGSKPAPATPSTNTTAAAAGSAATQPLVPAGEAKVGDRTKCPVSGDEFVVTADSPHQEYNGKTYYFCCPDCPKKFAANPEKYVPKT